MRSVDESPRGKQGALEREYADAGNVGVRIDLYRRFSTHPVPWQRWLFDRIHLPAGARVLEVGCGPGTLWRENRDRLRADWHITLSDFSAGMLRDVRRNLADLPLAFDTEVADLRAVLPFDDRRFDAVVACHTLFHVADLGHTLGELWRVLRPGGALYATTFGRDHLRELRELVQPLGSVPPMPAFLLGTGAGELGRLFPSVELELFDNALAVTEAGPVVDYLLSYDWLKDSDRGALTRAVEERRMASGGVFRITVDVGLFTARRAAAA